MRNIIRRVLLEPFTHHQALFQYFPIESVSICINKDATNDTPARVRTCSSSSKNCFSLFCFFFAMVFNTLYVILPRHINSKS